MVLAAFSFSLMALFARLAGARVPSLEIVFFRSLVTLVLTWAFLRRAGLGSWRGTHRGLLILRGVFGFGALGHFAWKASFCKELGTSYDQPR